MEKRIWWNIFQSMRYFRSQGSDIPARALPRPMVRGPLMERLLGDTYSRPENIL